MLRLPAVTFKGPLSVTSEPAVVFALIVIVPAELWLIVAAAAEVKTPSTPKPAIKVTFPADVLFVKLSLTLMFRRAFNVKVLVFTPVQVKGDPAEKVISPFPPAGPPGV